MPLSKFTPSPNILKINSRKSVGALTNTLFQTSIRSFTRRLALIRKHLKPLKQCGSTIMRPMLLCGKYSHCIIYLIIISHRKYIVSSI